MRRSSKPILIASRRSELAKKQAQLVGAALSKRHPSIEIKYLWVESEGDQRGEDSLADSGGKGLFTKAVEQAVLDGKADLAVHSLKDLPAAEETPGLSLAAITKRADVQDCLISKTNAGSIEDLPGNAVVGTASPRRAAQVLSLRPDIEIKLMRGNIETRIAKALDNNSGYDATLLAKAGLLRLGLDKYTQVTLPEDKMLPSAGQGALAIQCRATDHTAIIRLLAMNDSTSAYAVNAERRFVKALGGDCHSPLAVLVQPIETHPLLGGSANQGGNFRLRIRVLSPDGKHRLEADEVAHANGLSKAVDNIAEDLISRGANKLIAQASKSPAINQ